MKKVKIVRLVSVIVLAVMFLVMSLYLFLPRRGDTGSGVTALCFIDEDRLFPQMDYSQLFSSLDISSTYSVGEKCTLEQMKEKLNQVIKEKKAEKVVLVCDGDYALSGLKLASEETRIKTLVLLTPEISEEEDLSAFGTKARGNCHYNYSGKGKKFE